MLGMGSAVEGYNRALDELTRGLYRNFGIDGMLTVQRG
jgi:hypothetical protein